MKTVVFSRYVIRCLKDVNCKRHLYKVFGQQVEMDAFRIINIWLSREHEMVKMGPVSDQLENFLDSSKLILTHPQWVGAGQALTKDSALLSVAPPQLRQVVNFFCIS